MATGDCQGRYQVYRVAVWQCGHGNASPGGKFPVYPKRGICGRGTTNILYGWAMNAPKLNLPEGVGFEVGQKTQNKYLVLQVRYTELIPCLKE